MRVVGRILLILHFVSSVIVVPSVARDADKPIRIHIETQEPSLASSAHLTIDGKCFGKKIELRAGRSSSQILEVTARYGAVQRRFGIETPFVRDLFSGRVVLQYFIVCAGSGFQLTAWGASFEGQASARFVRGLVTFDEKGRIEDYDMSTEAYLFIRDHLRQ